MRTEVNNFEELLHRASGIESEAHARNAISLCMDTESKRNAVTLYNENVRESNHRESLHQKAESAALLLGRPDLYHEIYLLLQKGKPNEPVR